ncbi:MAG: hypothetical protein A2Y89_07550 [Chloroflexi bacterium RBG_13_51_18]|nr:MAG: hypothetical protein A2Y89_07550 [Chloroflexi bacterium RBG_13_51_18]
MEKARTNTLDWLLEPGDIGVKYLAMRDLVKASAKELMPVKQAVAKKAAQQVGHSPCLTCPECD